VGLSGCGGASARSGDDARQGSHIFCRSLSALDYSVNIKLTLLLQSASAFTGRRILPSTDVSRVCVTEADQLK